MGPEGPAGAPGMVGPEGPQGVPGPSFTFTDEGLVLELLSVDITDDGTATVDFRITDEEGTALDLDGGFTPGEVSVRFVLAWLDAGDSEGPGQYTAYTTRTQMSDITGESAVQASADSGGTFEELASPGEYRYTFGTTIEVADPTLTHTVGAWAEREVEGEEHVSSATLSFVPDGSDVTVTREVVTDMTCNNCHGEIAAHGGARQGVQMCILCHTPQTVDPDTGNTVDFKVMAHKIHRGAGLPSVEAGGTYEIIGYSDRSHDYSEVHFPQEVQNCDSCHATGADSSLAYERPTRATCTSCHDRTSFVDPEPAGFTLHTAGAFDDDGACSGCHPASGGLAGVQDIHETPWNAPDRPQLDLTLISINDTAPGDAPTLRFRVEVDGTGRDILTDPIARLRATIAGPNTDFARHWQVDLLDDTVGTLTTVDAAAGEFDYTFAAADGIPADATGSYTIGLEGELEDTDTGEALPALAPTMPFAVTDSTPVPRHEVVTADNCNSCHGELRAHGDHRTNPNYCIMCHRPGNANEERAAQLEGEQILVESVDFKVMVHKIHAGELLTQQYILGGYPPPDATDPDGNPINFGEEVKYPRELSNCAACHTGETYQLPLPEDRLPSTLEVRDCTEDPTADGNDFCEAPNWVLLEEILLQPERAVCTSCHDAPSTSAHAEVMTTSTGEESCATCHGSGSSLDVSTVHGALP